MITKKFFVIDEPVFARELICSIGMTADETLKQLKKCIVKPEYLEDFDKHIKDGLPAKCEGIFVSHYSGLGIIWIPNSAQDNFAGTLVHELLHAVFFFAETIGIKYNRTSEEWFTYMNGFFFKEIVKELKLLTLIKNNIK